MSSNSSIIGSPLRLEKLENESLFRIWLGIAGKTQAFLLLGWKSWNFIFGPNDN